MNHSLQIANASNTTCPDCIKCLRKKLLADGAAMFVKTETGWVLGKFEAESPQHDAEFKFMHVLKIGLPEIVSKSADGIRLTDNNLLKSTFPGMNELFSDTSVLAAPVNFGDVHGIRFAWREASYPFSAQDLETLRCYSECPPGLLLILVMN